MTEFARWVRSFHKAGEHAPRVVYFPHAGGAASYFFPFSAKQSPGAEVLAVQYPGRQDRRSEPGLTSIEALATPLADLLAPLTDDKPTVLFGHSMGAMVAYEVAARLQQRGGKGAAHLVVSGRRSPTRPVAELVHTRDDAGVLREIGLLNGTDGAVLQDPEIIEMIMPAIRSDYTAVETYRPAGHIIECPVTVFVGDDDPRTPVEDARAWSELAGGDFDLQVFPGGHFYLAEQADAVVAALGRLQG